MSPYVRRRLAAVYALAGVTAALVNVLTGGAPL